MAFKDFPDQQQGITLLQRSLERGRLGHAYLFSGAGIGEMERLAATLAKTLNCKNPVRAGGAPIDCCDQCASCRKIDAANHADVLWIRPESKMRVVRMSQIARREDSPPRVLIEFINLKPTEGEYKVAIIAGADRMNDQAANAFLKTLEEPPSKSILILLTTEPQRILETIISRCLRLNFFGSAHPALDAAQAEWLARFGEMASTPQKSLLGRYCLLDVLLKKLGEMREGIEQTLEAQSPLQRHKEADKGLKDQWEDELKAAVEAEYRRQRADLLGILQGWLRDAWLLALRRTGTEGSEPREAVANLEDLLAFRQVGGAEKLARRITPRQGLENVEIIDQLQRWLHTNVQEALALEVGLLKLHL